MNTDNLQESSSNQNEDYSLKKKKAEAILFATGRFCELDELIKYIQVKDKKELKKIIHELQSEYSQRDSALKIIELDNEFKMIVRDDYLEDIRNVLSNMEISRAVLETLAIIAWKKSILQSDVIKVRGNSAYEHIRELEDLCFVTSVREGVSKRLTVTEKFYEYFNLGGEDLTNKMRREEQERLRILEAEMKKKEEEERRIKEEEKLQYIKERQEEIEKKKQALGISDGQLTLDKVSEKENAEIEKTDIDSQDTSKNLLGEYIDIIEHSPKKKELTNLQSGKDDHRNQDDDSSNEEEGNKINREDEEERSLEEE